MRRPGALISVIAGALLLAGGCLFTAFDLVRASEQARMLYSVDTVVSQLVGEIQYHTQESRRSFLYALALTDPNEQLPYIDRTRATDQIIDQLSSKVRRVAGSGDAAAYLANFQPAWAEYNAARDEVIALILEGNARHAIAADASDAQHDYENAMKSLRLGKSAIDAQAKKRSADVNRTIVRCGIELTGLLLGMLAVIAALGKVSRARSIALRSLEAQNRELSVTRRVDQGRAEILEMVSTHAPSHSILKSVAELYASTTTAAGAAIWLLQDGNLNLRAAAGMPANFENSLASYKYPMSEDGAEDLAALAVAVKAQIPEPLPTLLRTYPLRDGTGKFVGMIQFFGRADEFDGPARGAAAQVAQLASIAVENRRLYEQLSFQAQHDPLTELPNRLLFHDRLQQALRVAERRHTRSAVIWMDLDRYKQINDTLGHMVGDELLREVGRRLMRCVGSVGTVARVGGDEFTVMLAEVDTVEQAGAIASKVLGAISAPIRVAGHDLAITASCGISIYPDHGSDASTLTRNADLAMYKAKRDGRNAYRVFAVELGNRVERRLEIEQGLRRAIESNELRLEYQPLISRSGHLEGVEALLRWRSETLGPVSPADFIPIAEELGLIHEIGQWVIRQACLDGVAWRSLGLAVPRIAVNVSPLQLMTSDFAVLLRNVLSEVGYPASALEVEVTETALMKNMAAVIDQIEALRSMGIHIAIDDFGTGYSSLSHLRSLPVDVVKIDRSFIRDLNNTENGCATLVRGIIGLAHNLKLKVVAEGIESEEQLKTLCGMGCDINQGFYLYRPMPARSIVETLQRQYNAGERSLSPA